MEKTNGPRLEMESDDVDIKHEPLEADMEYYVSILGCLIRFIMLLQMFSSKSIEKTTSLFTFC